LLLLFPAIFAGAGESVVARVLSWRACAWLGLISYGIFLWHFVVIQRLGAAGLVDFVPLLVATLAITVALAAASYYLVERPVLRFKYRRRSRKRVDSGPPHPGPLPYPPGRGRPAG
jgi:peptidoglycan/LPS O-acetylase OafA/YrhL